MKRAEKKNHLLNVATELFNKHGYHNVGIDQIIDQAGVAKTTLYRHFRTKDELIVAVLNRLGDQFRSATREAVDNMAKVPEEKIVCLFDVLENWFSQDSFHGCPFVSAMGEFGERKNPIFQEAVLHKRLMLAYFAELARSAGIDDPELVAEELNLLYEGAITMAKLTGKPETAQQAKTVLLKILKSRPIT